MVEHKKKINFYLSLLLLLYIFTLAEASEDNPQCKVENKIDCGWFGITREQCESVNWRDSGSYCCFEEYANPQCFLSAGSPCDLPQEARIDCGDLSNCHRRGCCTDPSNAPHCYYPTYSVCHFALNERVACGDPSINRGRCESQSCCFDSNHEPKCYQPQWSKRPSSTIWNLMPYFFFVSFIGFLVILHNYCNKKRVKTI